MKAGTEPLVFVVRMWVQRDGGTSAAEWRGSVKDIASGQLLYVTGARDIADFIGGRLAERATTGAEEPPSKNPT